MASRVGRVTFLRVGVVEPRGECDEFLENMTGSVAAAAAAVALHVDDNRRPALRVSSLVQVADDMVHWMVVVAL